jgi:D-alanyl-D-alanine carboxypeptidase (penicillin-binding protein 5/6)
MTLRVAGRLAALILLPFFAVAARAAIPEPPALRATSYVLYDAASGTVLVENNPTLQVGPASITKVMLAYIVFDEVKKGRIKLTDEVTISEKAWRQGKDSTESRMFLDLGSRVKVEDLLHGIITQSGNDASVALAEHVAGSESAFADLMNQYAKRLGMQDSHFTNAPGMPDAQHFSTARDLALLGAALIRDFPEYYPWFALPEFSYNGIKQQNRNMMLAMDRSVDGIKTGHTEAAGYCMLSSAKRDDRRLVAAVMGTEGTKYRAEASLELLNYGFRFFESIRLLGKDAPAGTVKLWKGAADEVQVGTLVPIHLALPRGSAGKAEVRPAVTGTLIAPLTAGQAVGTVEVLIDGKVARTEPLVVLADAPAGGFFKRLWHTIRLWFA